MYVISFVRKRLFHFSLSNLSFFFLIAMVGTSRITLNGSGGTIILTLHSERPGCSVRTFHSGWLEWKTSLSSVISQSYSVYGSSLFSSPHRILLCVCETQNSAQDPRSILCRAPAFSMQLSPFQYPASQICCSLSDSSLCLSSTLRGCLDLLGTCFLHCGLEFVCRQKVGAAR